MYTSSGPAADAAIATIQSALAALPIADRLVALRSLSCLLGTGRAATVLAARTAGMSWQEIADRLGMSRQAVWERYVAEDIAPPPPARGRPPRPRPGLHFFSNCAAYKAVTTSPPRGSSP
ncbi:MAG: helix-turn-helix domain-containing protein [Candidatus Dormibacteria bacterium]